MGIRPRLANFFVRSFLYGTLGVLLNIPLQLADLSAVFLVFALVMFFVVSKTREIHSWYSAMPDLFLFLGKERNNRRSRNSPHGTTNSHPHPSPNSENGAVEALPQEAERSTDSNTNGSQRVASIASPEGSTAASSPENLGGNAGGEGILVVSDDDDIVETHELQMVLPQTRAFTL
jgi:hypothetical protein